MTPERFQTLKAALARRQPDLTVLAENVHKPHNVAALLRSCDAVGVHELNAVSPTGAFERPHMVAGGTVAWVRVRLHPEIAGAISHLKANKYQILAAHFSAGSIDYRAPDYTRPTAILMGSELYGVSAEAAALADAHVMIPMRGLAASLNVSVAAALILFEAARQREAAGLYDASRLPPAEFERTLFEWAHPRIAAVCRRRGRPYPPLDEHGELLAHPFGPGAGG